MAGNLFWGMRFRTCRKFWESTDSSLVESPKNLTNTKATPPLLRLFFALICHSEPKAKNLKRNIFRFCDSQNLVKNNPCVSTTENSPASWCKKSDLRLQKCNRRFFARSGESEALPLKAKKRSFLARRGSGAGGAALFAINKANLKNKIAILSLVTQ